MAKKIEENFKLSSILGLSSKQFVFSLFNVVFIPHLSLFVKKNRGRSLWFVMWLIFCFKSWFICFFILICKLLHIL